MITSVARAGTAQRPVIGRPAGRFHGRVALVTGGARGIGAAISRQLADDGATIAAAYRQGRGPAEMLVEDLAHSGVAASIHQGHVGSPYDCERVVAEVLERHGRLDLLVNNAGMTVDKSVLKMTPHDWNEVLSVNLSGAFYLSKLALEHMLTRGTGRIVNISSIIGQTGNIGQANYAAAKAGLFGLTMSMAREAAQQLHKTGRLHADTAGVTVNAVAPGFIDTEMVAAVPSHLLERIVQQIPVKRLGRPDEIARIVAFLCDDASSYITGQVWAVNGGMDM